MSGSLLVLAEGDIPARAQMGASLGFHIIFACFGIAFPTVVLIAHWLGIRRGDQVALVLAQRWSRVAAVIFAVGAVSGTVLSYELGLLWPGLMGRYGSAFGIPFAIEGIWFFVEAIFTAIYLYGWGRLPPWLHWWSGTPMVIAGLLGALAVVAANSWMNQPSGFTLQDGRVASVDPWAVIFNRATPFETPHMILAAYMVVGFVVAGVYAVGLLRGRWDRYHRLGFLVPFWVGAVCAPLQVLMGDVLARAVAHQQPIKFAAMELVADTQRGVTEWLGGIYWNGEVYFGVGIPYLDSLLVGFSPNTEVIGWNSVPPQLRPPLPNLLHLSFDGMVAIGTALMVLGAWQAWVWKFRREVLSTWWFLVPAALAGAASIVAMELGWLTTEVGRQPWVVYGLLLTRDAVTPAGGVPVTLAATIVVYGVLTATSIGVPWLMGRRWQTRDAARTGADSVQTPYGPPPARAEESRA
ncbi:cytochrome ubiquinol oxidase subunit I [Pseudonocardia acidicola]